MMTKVMWRVKRIDAVKDLDQDKQFDLYFGFPDKLLKS